MPDVYFGLFGGDWMAVSAIHARERRAIHKRGQRGAPMTLNINYGIKDHLPTMFHGHREELSPTVIMSPQTANHDTRTCYLQRINNISR